MTLSAGPPRLLVAELWGIGDLALAIPFLRTAATKSPVTVMAKPAATALLRRLAPGVDLLPVYAPWTEFSGKYRFHRWPWSALRESVRAARAGRFDLGVSARPDPRDHLLLTLAGARRRVGFPRAGSQLLLNTVLPAPSSLHRAAHWAALAGALGWPLPEPASPPPDRSGRHLVVHTGAARAVRRWPRARFDHLVARARDAGWTVTVLDDSLADLDRLLDVLASANRFVGNDSGPGHLAALLGVPTFTIFGPQLPERFAPVHPQAAWIEGGPCPYKPCFDACRFPEPHCLLATSEDAAWTALSRWLALPRP